MQGPLQLAPGTIFAGFRIERPLAEGGMGAVYVAEQISTRKLRALKVMHPQLVPDEKSRGRFTEEAQIGASIASEHVVEVVDAGVDAESGAPWLAMELLDGDDLAAVVEREGALPLPVMRSLFREVGHALSAAHSRGIIHRDLKPENVFVARSRRVGAAPIVKILDFGIAKTMAESRTGVTVTTAIGSPLFMAPEQGTPGAQLRPSTDVWALGLIAFYTLTGKHYWRSMSSGAFGLQALLSEVLVHPLEAPAVRARAIGATAPIPAGFDEWFLRCVARTPEERYSEAGAALDALVSLLGDTEERASSDVGNPRASVAATLALPTSSGTMPIAPAAATTVLPPEPPRRSPWILAGAVVTAAVLLGAVAIGVGLTSSGEPDAHVSMAAPSANGAVASPPDAAEAAEADPQRAHDALEPDQSAASALPRSLDDTSIAGPNGQGDGETDGVLDQALGASRSRARPPSDAPSPPAARRPAAPRSAQGENDIDRMLDDALRRNDTAPAGTAPRHATPAPAPQAAASDGLPEQPSRTDIARTLGRLMPQIRQCAGDQVGMALARIIVSSDGSVTSVAVGGSPFGGTPRGACMEGAIRGAQFPPFRQSTFRVSYPFNIR